MKNSRLFWFLISVIAMLGLDKITKIIAQNHLQGRGFFSCLGNTIRLVYVENTGAFLSFGSQLSRPVSLVIFSVLPLLTLAYLAYYIIKNRNRLELAVFIAFTMIFAGGVGNVLDRILNDRHVIDFLNVGIGNLRTGIFNVADMYITSGVILFLFLSLNLKKKNTKNVEDSANPSEPA